MAPPRCQLCGRELTTGLIASDRRTGCCGATPIVGACPEHGPLGPHHVTAGESSSEEAANVDGDANADDDANVDGQASEGA